MDHRCSIDEVVQEIIRYKEEVEDGRDGLERQDTVRLGRDVSIGVLEGNASLDGNHGGGVGKLAVILKRRRRKVVQIVVANSYDYVVPSFVFDVVGRVHVRCGGTVVIWAAGGVFCINLDQAHLPMESWSSTCQ